MQVAISSLFSGTIASLVGEDFLHRQLGREVVLVQADPAAVVSLLTWEDLNEILATRGLLAPRLRLSRGGSELPVASYARVTGQGEERREIIQPEELYAQLRDGATLIIDAVEGLHPPVAAATEDLVRLVREPAQANLYVTWGMSQGFNTHWDDHDTFIVQVQGTKSWTVHGAGRPFPMRRDVTHDHTCPDAVVWEGVLTEGQVLHVPRGWWHTVRGAGDVSIHITFGFGRRTGIDWVGWVVDQLRHHELFRQDLPRFAPVAEWQAHERALLQCLDREFKRNTLDAYFRHRDELVPRRYEFDLPLAVTFSMPDDSDLVEFTPVFSPSIDRGNGQLTLATGRKSYAFAPCMDALLAALAADRQIPCGELRKRSALDAATFSAALEILVEQHLVTIRPPRVPMASQAGDLAPASPGLTGAK